VHDERFCCGSWRASQHEGAAAMPYDLPKNANLFASTYLLLPMAMS
jgi:hypothetical protein